MSNKRNCNFSLSRDFHLAIRRQADKFGMTASAFIEHISNPILEQQIEWERRAGVHAAKKNTISLTPDTYKMLKTSPDFRGNVEAAAEAFITLGHAAFTSDNLRRKMAGEKPSALAASTPKARLEDAPRKTLEGDISIEEKELFL